MSPLSVVNAFRLAAAIAACIPAAAVRSGPRREAIAAAVAAIVERFRPERVVLYGSRAYGRPRSDSDIDLMVVMDSSVSSTEQMWQIRAAVEQPLGGQIDVKVRTPAEIALGLTEGDFFIEDVMLKGVTLYARDGLRSDARPTADQAFDNGGSFQQPGLKRVTKEWLEKAESNLRAASRLAAPPEPILDGACFHAQQSVEKYLKAFLQQHGIRFPRTHDLGKLAALVGDRIPALVGLEADFAWLKDFAVTARYLGAVITADDAARSLRVAGDVQAAIRSAVGLPVPSAT